MTSPDIDWRQIYTPFLDTLYLHDFEDQVKPEHLVEPEPGFEWREVDEGLKNALESSFLRDEKGPRLGGMFVSNTPDFPKILNTLQYFMAHCFTVDAAKMRILRFKESLFIIRGEDYRTPTGLETFKHIAIFGSLRYMPQSLYCDILREAVERTNFSLEKSGYPQLPPYPFQ